MADSHWLAVLGRAGLVNVTGENGPAFRRGGSQQAKCDSLAVVEGTARSWASDCYGRKAPMTHGSTPAASPTARSSQNCPHLV